MTAGPAILSGRRGVVLGVSGRNGVGYHCATRFKEWGAEVAITHRAHRSDVVRPLAAEHGLRSAELDVTDEASIERAVSQLGETLGHIDFLVHTLVHVPAGTLDRPVVELAAKDFALALDVSVRSLLAACRYALPWLERSKAPRVVTLLSSGGELAIPNYHLAGIAKGALSSALRYLALELGPKGVLCNAVSFSMLDTDAAVRVIGAETTTRTREYLARRAPTRRAVDFDDVVTATAFFASEWCRNITGESITVDGGFSNTYF